MNRRRWLLLLATVALVAALLPVAVGLLILDREPLLDAGEVAEVDDAVRTRELVKRTWLTLKGQGGDLRFTEEELNSAFAFVARGTGRIRGRAGVGPGGVTLTVAARLPDNPLGRYLNGWASVGTGPGGLHLRRVVLGDLAIPGTVALPLLRFALNAVLGDQTGTLALSTVRAVATEGNTAVVRLAPVPDLEERLERLKTRFKRVRDQVALLGDPALVRLYYERLIAVDRALSAREPARLGEFLQPLFGLARERGNDPAEENRAALLALAMFLGSQRFGSFVGPVHTDATRAYQLRHRQATLAGRTDLRLHFLISAGFKVVADSGLSHALGEFKELLDARRGGSGFSFADLAADRAGVAFAEAALDGSGGAVRLQDQLSRGVEDGDLVPDPAQLPEGLTREEFTAFFGDVESPAYRTLVGAIDGCLETFPLYASGLRASAAAPGCDIMTSLPPGLAGHLEVRRGSSRAPSRVGRTAPKPLPN